MYTKVFTDKQELKLLQHITVNKETMFGFTVDDILKFRFEITKGNRIKHRFSTMSHTCGKNWLREFRQRHSSAARARAFHKPIVDKFLQQFTTSS